MKYKILFLLVVYSVLGFGQPLNRSIVRTTQYVATDTIKAMTGNGLNVWNNKIKLLADPVQAQDAVNLRTLQNGYVAKGDSIVQYVTPTQLNSYIYTQPNDTVQELSGTTPTWDVSRGIHAIITLSGNTTITLSDITKSFSGNITVINPSGAAYTLTFSGYTNKISPAVYSAANQVTCSGDSKIDVFSWWYDGTRLFWNGTNDYQ